MEDFPVATRLKNLIEALGLSDSQFADKCSISRSTLSLLLAGKNKKISDVLLSQIHEAFPNVSILWLLFGEGEKFNQENINENTPNEDETIKFPGIEQKDDKDLNLVSVKRLENIIQDVINKAFCSSYPTLEKLVLKTQETPYLRKVNKITVYYDDSTFETFIPE